MYPLPTLYKARNLATKRPVCAICLDRTNGRTVEIRLGYRVTVWLCPGHASREFQTKRGGRDFVRTLMGAWQAHGCLTAARDRALDAHLRQLRGSPLRDRRASTRPKHQPRLPRLHRPHPQPPHPPALARRTPLAHPPALAIRTDDLA